MKRSYNGSITLMNINESSVGQPGVGIREAITYYAVSSNGSTPPELEGVPLVTETGDLLSVEDSIGTFSVDIEGKLAIVRSGAIIKLSTSSDLITSTNGWSTNMMDVGPGQYLWSKIIFTYTNDTQTIIYNVARQGRNGEDALAYELDINQAEILKFVDAEGNVNISPNELVVSVMNRNSQSGGQQVRDISLNNFSMFIRNIQDGLWIEIQENVFSLENDSIVINLETLALNGSEISSIFILQETVLKLVYELETEGTVHSLTDYLSVRYGMNKDMAQLSLNATGLAASMQGSRLVFNSNGLRIQNGGFVIQDISNKNIFYADQQGNLCLIGNIYANDGYFKGELQGATGTFSGELRAASGTFSGLLEAAAGSFKGDISAATGKIGGFILNRDSLVSVSEDSLGQPNLVLNGTTGIVEAKNIILGSGAQIREYIQIGDTVQLRKPTEIDDSFIRVRDNSVNVLSLSASGIINVGNGDNMIIISGQDGSIMTQNYLNNSGWKISNTESVFNNVKIRGSIRASVFEYDKTQAIGGVLVARPSGIITDLEVDYQSQTTSFSLDSILGFQVGDYCRVDYDSTQNYYQIIAINENRVAIQGTAPNIEGYPIINFGRTGTVGIGINGSIDSALVASNAVSVFEFDEITKNLKTHIILGKLPNEPAYGAAAGTYGLYAENVLLKGSLVTQSNVSQGASYSGISTLYSGANQPTSEQYASWFTGEAGEILLWAGARSTSKKDIEDSNFFVDRNGNLFANSGYFRGTIITDATIAASVIETAVIRGSGESPALSIEDAKRGILFRGFDEELSEFVTVFEVAKNKINANVPAIIFNQNFEINERGAFSAPAAHIVGNSCVAIEPTQISYYNSFEEGILDGRIDFQNGISFMLKNNKKILDLSQDEIGVYNSLYISSSVRYNELMEYKPVYKDGELIGYDLYVE